MKHATHDALGRIKDTYSEVDLNIRCSPLGVRVGAVVHQFGYASLPFIKDAIMLDQKVNPRSFEHVMLQLRKGGYLNLPLQHFIPQRRNKFYIYKPTKRMINVLADKGYKTDLIKVAEDGVHDYGVAFTYGSLVLGFRRMGCEVYPGHFFMHKAKATHTYAISKDHNYRSDQLFGVKYPDGKQVLYVHEHDNKTEQMGNTARSEQTKRKTLENMIRDLELYVSHGGYRDHLAIKKNNPTPMKALVTFSSRSRELSFHKLLAKHFKKCPDILTRTMAGLDTYEIEPYPPDYTLVDEGWNRHGYQEPYLINRP